MKLFLQSLMSIGKQEVRSVPYHGRFDIFTVDVATECRLLRDVRAVAGSGNYEGLSYPVLGKGVAPRFRRIARGYTRYSRANNELRGS